MKLNHLNLVVSNVAETVDLFERYFNFKCTTVKGDNVIAVLSGADDSILVLMTDKQGVQYPDAFHIGFIFDSVEQVNETWLKLKNGGILIEGEPKKIRNSFGFYFHFDSIMIEVGHYMK